MAPEKRDFSGDWVLDRQACSLSSGADGIQSATVQIDHREPTFHYKGTFTGEGGSINSEYELQTDGREVTGAHGPITVVSRLSWEGDALVVSMRIGEMSIRFQYELLDDGRGLRATEQLCAPEREQDNVWMFERA